MKFFELTSFFSFCLKKIDRWSRPFRKFFSHTSRQPLTWSLLCCFSPSSFLRMRSRRIGPTLRGVFFR